MESVVNYSAPSEIAFVRMEEREYKNTFSKRLVAELLDVFEAIEKNEKVKVVVVQGYGNYFCCGGTQEELLQIQEGKVNFAEFRFYDLLLRCPVPVIAAMSGHAMGGGLVFGCYADIVLLARECYYGTNFMRYGFTPGFGATSVIPRKFGLSLGTEMLLAASNYSGEELKKRGVPFQVLKKGEVDSRAREIAEILAEKPRESLKLLKKHLSRDLLRESEALVEKEQEMHQISFQQPQVRERILESFGKL